MDTRILKSAGKAVAIVAGICLSYILVGIFLSSMGSSYATAYYSLYSLAGIAVFLLSTPSLGFLSTYFFMKNKGSLTLLNLCLLVFTAVLMFSILTLLSVLVMWIYSIYRFYSQPFPGDIASVYGIYSVVMVLVVLLFFFLIELVLSFAGACMGTIAALLILTSAEEKKQWNIHAGILLFILGSFLLIVLLAGLILWQLGPSPPPSNRTVTIGWSKLQPLSASILYDASDQTFSALFMNAVGTPIKIDSVTVNESISGTMCSVAVQEGQRVANQTVAAGDTLQIEAKCPSARKMRGDSYDMEITVDYYAVTGSLITQHTEKGLIGGPAEEGSSD